jgi:hypothetical protein
MLAMNGSILESDLHKPTKAAPALAPVVARAEQKPASEEAKAPGSVVLQVAAPLELFASAVERGRQAPLDHLSTHLLNPPTPPQFRLAFRTAVAAPDL